MKAKIEFDKDYYYPGDNVLAKFVLHGPYHIVMATDENYQFNIPMKHDMSSDIRSSPLMRSVKDVRFEISRNAGIRGDQVEGLFEMGRDRSIRGFRVEIEQIVNK